MLLGQIEKPPCGSTGFYLGNPHGARPLPRCAHHIDQCERSIGPVVLRIELDCLLKEMNRLCVVGRSCLPIVLPTAQKLVVCRGHGRILVTDLRRLGWCELDGERFGGGVGHLVLEGKHV